MTNGLNVINVVATDVAGNVTTTNFNLTLDYTSKTNPQFSIYIGRKLMPPSVAQTTHGVAG